jgi:Subtilase family
MDMVLHRMRSRLIAVAAAMLLCLVFATVPMRRSAPDIRVIVRELPGAGNAPERLVHDLGGVVHRHISLIHGFVAEVSADAVGILEAAPGVFSVTPDSTIHFLSLVDGMDPTKYPGSWSRVAHNTQLIDMWKHGYTGKGVDVALIDSGVAPVPGITTQVINGPDLSFESQASNLTDIDTYGHGTHMAGLIAGRDSWIPAGQEDEDVDKAFVGAAPGARIVSIKVASSDGATDVSQVLAAIDWVVQNRNTNGLNIRVLNLSFGTDGTQDYRLDPLTYAVESAWLHGIVVVVAAGNSGFGTTQLNDPAYDPYVIAVGADNTKGTDDPKDDVIPSWQTRGNSTRHPDLVAPGKSIISLRDPGGYVDQQYPTAEVGSTRFFKGGGSSQATAIVSGAVATLLQDHPTLTPDQVKALLMHTARHLPNADSVAQGAGLINMHAAREASPTTVANAVQTWPRSSGLGSLQLARGSVTAEDGGVVLQGEQDIFTDSWDASAWASASWSGSSWSGGSWNGRTWSGGCWCGSGWAGRTWSGASWTGSSWSGRTWSGRTWSGRTWSAGGWSSGTWGGSDAPSGLSAGAWSSTLWGD